MNEKKKVSILVGICSGQGLEERRNAVRDSWLRHPQEGVECLFFIGGEAAEEETGRYRRAGRPGHVQRASGQGAGLLPLRT
ncbi:hypothetical protein [Akkermansia sp. 54_46]|uniref:hypothetical protein n=1 Tax=Akkermansia sp. 54_46 TaxID=1896967 RepID=UPI000965CDAB|nr:hypothetical protein [Akkermansia sp. 54_46]OLA87900.1 MAG: hypothetical protein BHW66_12945 [Akkermansia sp. 54_46]